MSGVFHLARPGGSAGLFRRRRMSRLHFALSDALPLVKCPCSGCRSFRSVYLENPRPLRRWRACLAAWRLAGFSTPELAQLQRKVDRHRRRVGLGL